MPLRLALRNALAGVFRRLPPFVGKVRMGDLLQRWLTDYRADEECLAAVVLKGGARLRVDLRCYMEKWAFWTGQYDDDVIARLARCLGPRSVALDVGAHIGLYAIPLGQRLAKLGGRLYAFEPVRSNYDRLVEMIALNGLEKVVRPVRLALGEREGVADLALWEEAAAALTGNAVLLGDGVRGVATHSARLTRLDDAARELGIESCALLKADIEGGENRLLKGGAEFIARTRPLIYLELNYPWMRKRGWTVRDLTEFASPLGYHVYRLRQGQNVPTREPGRGVEHAVLVPLGTNAQRLARRHLRLPD
jgi:FkbM family methyltransferase